MMQIETELAAVLKAHQDNPYCWGKWDCMTFVNDCIGAVSGVDHMAPFKAYDTQGGALRSLRGFGYQSVFGFFQANFDAVDVSHVVMGDLVFMANGANKLSAPAVVFGDIAVSRTYDGWSHLRPRDFTVGFKVR